MSDLVKRLRDERDKARISAANYAEFNHEWRRRAEAITAERDELKAKLAKAVEALERLVALNDDYSPFGGELLQDRVDRTWQKARTTLAELTGGKSD